MREVEGLARNTGADLPDTWVEDFNVAMNAMLAESVQPIPGIVAVLDALTAAGIPYAVGSNGRAGKMQITLARTGLLDRFGDQLYSARDCAAPKPAPDVYLKAAQIAGIAPADCVVVEDSATGARAAVAAGMRCVGFTYETPAAKLSPHCDGLFADMSELPALLGL